MVKGRDQSIVFQICILRQDSLIYLINNCSFAASATVIEHQLESSVLGSDDGAKDQGAGEAPQRQAAIQLAEPHMGPFLENWENAERLVRRKLDAEYPAHISLHSTFSLRSKAEYVCLVCMASLAHEEAG
jgi:hypothetical protein